jgi:hypothetical protein
MNHATNNQSIIKPGKKINLFFKNAQFFIFSLYFVGYCLPTLKCLFLLVETFVFGVYSP